MGTPSDALSLPAAARPPHHVGYVVSDLSAGVEWMVTRLGAGPFFHIPHLSFDQCTFHDAPASYDHSSAFGQWGPVVVELTVVHGSEPPELAALIGGPTPRFGHVGIVAEDLERESAALADAGLPVFHTGSSGPVAARWHDGRAQLRHHVELLQRCPELMGFYALIAQTADGWDGRDSLRPGPGGSH